MPQSFINKVLAGFDISGEVHICGKKLQNPKNSILLDCLIVWFTRKNNNKCSHIIFQSCTK